jgi:leucyl-tRNA synthetase
MPGEPSTSRAPHAPSDQPACRYTAALAGQIEARWQDFWQEQGTFRAPNPGEPGFDGSRPKKYILDMFPYPSGVGLHVGHPLGYIATDIFARYQRMTGHNVLHAMGYDAFGLPAEQYAIQTGTHPRITTERNIQTMRAQLRRLGLAHDDRRSVATTDPGFYKWTQWIFLQLYHSWYDSAADKARPVKDLAGALESGALPTRAGRPWRSLSADERRTEIDSRRLAYVDELPVNWCPQLGTVLANEEVTADGRSERGNFPVYRRPLRQWMLRITAYAERLLRDLDSLDWPEPIKLMQRNWIGRSEGAFADFVVPGGTQNIVRVFTTRPDTLFGATYVVLSPEHPLVDQIATDDWADAPKLWRGRFPGAAEAGYATPREAIAAYRQYARGKSDVQRAEAKTKTGVFTGARAINPVTGRAVPVFIADYVLTGYGTGAIMAVPAHDERDREFAAALQLPTRIVVIGEANVPPEAQHCLTQDFDPARHYSVVYVPASNPDYALSVEEILARRSPDLVRLAGSISILGRGAWGVCFLVHRPMEDEFLTCLRAPGSQWSVGSAREHEGFAVNSSSDRLTIDGLATPEAKRAVVEWLERNKLGRGAVTYKLRDWLFSRQRYWGEPFPIVYDERGHHHALPETMLPVQLPELENFTPESSDDPDAPPRPPLGRAHAWSTVELDLGGGKKRYTRELNTMPNWAGSCWYYLRYLDPENEEQFCAPGVERYWMKGTSDGDRHIGGVDLYVGGVEHAVLHLLYARFWHKVLFDLGRVSTPEPFQTLFNQGYIQAAAYTDERGVYVEAEEVEDRAGKFFYDGKPVSREFGKMGKSLKNAVAPDDIFREYGCDTMRIYEMSMGPLEASKPWNTRDIVGAYRFLQRVWRNLIHEETGELRTTNNPADAATLRLLHKTIKGVRRDMDQLGFNTVVAKLIELNNHLGTLDAVPREVAAPFILMLAPLAPHIAEELWHRLHGPAPGGMAQGGTALRAVSKQVDQAGHRSESGAARSLAFEPYPIADDALAADDVVEVPVQIAGKVRARISIPAGLDAKATEAAALADPRVQESLGGKPVKKVIVVPGRMVNIVV